MDHNTIKSRYRPWQRVTALLTVFFMLFQVSAGAVANIITISNSDIESRLEYAPEFVKVDDVKHQFKTVEGLNLREKETYKTASDFYKILQPASIDNHKYIGAVFPQVRLIRSQIYGLLGRQLPYASTLHLETEAKQFDRLYENAAAFANDGHSFGQVQTFSIDSSPYDMIWPELRTINKEQVIVPVVYLTSKTMQERKVTGQVTEFGGNIDFATMDVNDVTVKFTRDAFIKLSGDFKLTNAEVIADASLKAIVGGDLSLMSSQITAQNDINLGAHSVSLGTIVHRYDLGGNAGQGYGEVTEVIGSSSIGSEIGSIIVKSDSDIIIRGSHVEALQGAITFAADGSIYIGPERVSTSFNGREGKWKVDRSDLTYVTSSLSAQDTIKLIAKGQITIDAAEIISSQGHIDILAGLGISIIDQLETHQYNKKYSKKGRFGQKKKKTLSGYQTFAIRSVLDAGKGIKLHAVTGDIILKAADIRSAEGAQVKATDGQVSLLLSKETDHYSYSSVKNGLATNSTKSSGHQKETAVYPTIVGGLKIDAFKGVNIEYGGLKDQDCDGYLREHQLLDIDGLDACAQANIEAIGSMEGMGWMKDVLASAEANPEQYNWNEIKLASKTWSKSNTSISPALVAVITIVVAIYAGPLAANFVAGAGAGTAVSAALAAGLTGLVTQGTIAIGNGAVNGGRYGEAFAGLDNDDTWRNLAISMVTAGAIAQVNAEFFGGISGEGIHPDLIGDAGKLSLQGQLIQAVTNATVSAGISTLANGGDLNSFETAFAQGLAQRALAELGKHAAEKIGGAWDNQPGSFDTAMKYILHAGAGCTIGALGALNQNNQSKEDGCSYGALGAVTGELVGSIYKSKTEEDVQKSQAAITDMLARDKEYVDELISTAASKGQTLTRDQILAELRREDVQYTHYEDEISKLKQQGVDLAQLSSALVAFAAGASAAGVSTSAEAGENAAENNALFLLAALPFILKAIDLAITGHEIYQAYKEIDAAYNGEGGNEDKGDEALAKFIYDSVEGGVHGKILEKLIPGGATLKKLSQLEILQKVKALGQSGIGKLMYAVEAAQQYGGKLTDYLKNKITNDKKASTSTGAAATPKTPRDVPGITPTFDDNFETHAVKVDIKKNKNGTILTGPNGKTLPAIDSKGSIKGGHNKDEFEAALANPHGLIDPVPAKVNPVKKVIMDDDGRVIGEDIKYQVPIMDRGKVVRDEVTGEILYKQEHTKSVYYPNLVSDTEMLTMLKTVGKKGYNHNLSDFSASSDGNLGAKVVFNGVDFTVWLNKDAAGNAFVKNVHLGYKGK